MFGLENRRETAYTNPMPPPASPATLQPETQHPSSASSLESSEPLRREIEAPQRNFLLFAGYQILMRTGWIFKTESIIMPAILDSISGAGWVRGCLPLLNRMGFGLSPLLMARRLKIMPRKKWSLALSTGCTAVLFLSLSALFYTGLAVQGLWWMPLAFLVIYGASFACIGVNQLAFNTLQGKLVEVTRRGRLLLFASTMGAASAILCAFFLLPGWLVEGAARFDLILGFSGMLFACAALTIVLLSEPADSYHEEPAPHFFHCFEEAYHLLAKDRNLRRLVIVAALFGTSLMLFPHYQSLGLRGMKLELRSLMWWVIIQNAGTGVFSIPAGAAADRYGNRLVLRFALLALAVAPSTAILLLHAGGLGIRLYHFVFLLIGLTPIVFKILNNYTLEVCPPEQQPRYLSTLSLCMALPMLASPAIGLLIDLIGFEMVFLTIAALILCGWGLTFRLSEPRRAG